MKTLNLKLSIKKSSIVGLNNSQNNSRINQGSIIPTWIFWNKNPLNLNICIGKIHLSIINFNLWIYSLNFESDKTNTSKTIKIKNYKRVLIAKFITNTNSNNVQCFPLNSNRISLLKSSNKHHSYRQNTP